MSNTVEDYRMATMKLDVNAILDRAAMLFDVDTDEELAKSMGISVMFIESYRRHNVIPWELLWRLSYRHAFDFDTLIAGDAFPAVLDNSTPHEKQLGGNNA